MNNREKQQQARWKQKLYEIIFRADTFYGKLFDEILLGLIILSIIVVMLESIPQYDEAIGSTLFYIEWVLTILFLIEYIFRIISSPRPVKYITSLFGVIDLLAILPTLIAFMVPGAQSFIIIRSVRLLRIYRILKLTRYIRAGNALILALKNSFRKILIFMIFVFIIVLLLGSIMYVVEKGENGFHSIPLSIYWAVITLTTVGYGDIVPVTDLGKFIATIIMLLGYSIIAIPTGIVSAEITLGRSDNKQTRICKNCQESDHQADANYCKSCGHHL